MLNSKPVNLITQLLLIIGGLNWGLAILGINLVTMILGGIPILVTIVYALVGISAIFQAIKLFK
jgi:uncharacterized membrane protein YuzA (DUF378 family)